MSEQKIYQRQRVGGYIIKVLQELGGSASKQKIKEGIVADNDNDLTYDNVFTPVKSLKSGNQYIPFNFDFNFGLKELLFLGYIEKYNRTTDIVLTESGRKANYKVYPNKEEVEKINEFWAQMHQDNENKKSKNENVVIEPKVEEEKQEDDLVDEETLQVKLLDMIKQFSPKKFESFSRNLISKMGIAFDSERGIKMSADHGIDGYGIFESDEFRTSKVVIQCKRFVEGHIGEPEIDKFRGVISKHSADYGIFITTTHFSEQAKKAAKEFNPTITLIDGQRLIELILKYGLGVKEVPVPYYSIDKYYTEKD